MGTITEQSLRARWDSVVPEKRDSFLVPYEDINTGKTISRTFEDFWKAVEAAQHDLEDDAFEDPEERASTEKWLEGIAAAFGIS